MLEDPESRLHPTMLALAWGLLEQLPGQKLLTTNSGTCSPPCPSIRCAVWCAASRTSSAISWEGALQQRRSAQDCLPCAHQQAHVDVCPLLAAGGRGDRDLAALGAGPDLRLQPAGGGVRIIEFAQCGQAPLIKVARDFGIEWHLLTDGDEAGAKYASSAAPLLKGSASGIG